MRKAQPPRTSTALRTSTETRFQLKGEEKKKSICGCRPATCSFGTSFGTSGVELLMKEEAE